MSVTKLIAGDRARTSRQQKAREAQLEVETEWISIELETWRGPLGLR